MPDLMRKVAEHSHEIDFFQAVSLLEEYFQKKGETKDMLDTGAIQFSPGLSFIFPPNDIETISIDDSGSIRFILSFMGMLGVSSPLPHYFSEYCIKYKEESLPLSDFLTIFNHRIYVLFYRAWKKYRIANMAAPDDSSGLVNKMAMLAGIHDSAQPKHTKLLAYTGLLSQSCRNAEGLKVLLSDYFNAIPVSITEFVDRWAEIRELKKLGEDSVLGKTTMIGTHMRDVAGKFRVILGPLERDIFETFLPDSQNIAMVKEVARQYCADPLEFDIEVKLASAVLSPVILGADNAALGITTSCGRSKEKSGEYSIIIAN